MKVVIVAAGLATRLQPITNHIPKILVNVGKQTGLVEMIRYWEHHSNDFTIVLHPKYERLVREYFDLYFKDTKNTLTIKTIDEALGTAHTIANTIGEEFHGREVLFSWCDIIPGNRFNRRAFDNAVTVFTNSKYKNRYAFTEDKLVQVPDGSGDVVGLYYVKKYEPFLYVDGEDFADVLDQFGRLESYRLGDIIDFGDKEKLFDVLDLADGAREFNSLEFIGDDLVLKSGLNKQGHDLMKREIEWYRSVDALDVWKTVTVPKIYPALDHTKFYMDRVDGLSIYKLFPDMDERAQSVTIAKVMDQLNRLHQLDEKTVRVEQAIEDITIEAKSKILSRCNEIRGVIDSFGFVNKVNGNAVLPFEKIVNSIHVDLINFHTKNLTAEAVKYNFIHGDLQFSNSMINTDANVVFIDPRGYFGKTQQYGLKEYDYAKVQYSLSGYDSFNYSRSFHIDKIADGEITFEIPTLNVKCDYKSDPLNPYFKKITDAWLVVIWLGLAGYIKNNPIKSVAAYYHGLDLGTRYIRSHGINP